MTILLSDPVSSIPFVGLAYQKRLVKLGITTISDLLNHYPARHDDFSLFSSIARSCPGETLTIPAKLLSIKNTYSKSKKIIQKAEVTDGTGSLTIIWFNQPFLEQALTVGESYNFSGQITFYLAKKALISPDYEKITPGIKPIHTGRLVPVYPETYGVSSKWLRSRIAWTLANSDGQIIDFLPQQIVSKNQLIDEKSAVYQIHFPDNQNTNLAARHRLAFDELFLTQMTAGLRRLDWQKAKSAPVISTNSKVADFISKLPYHLTAAQNRSVNEILTDMGTTRPMNRLLQGDVGSGKTIVAAIAAYATYLAGYQTIFMAPTEILAEQHYQTLTSLFEPLDIAVNLITGSTPKATKKNPGQKTKPDILIGTHALLYRQLATDSVGLVVIDEQHRFGVAQRGLLADKSKNAHLLTMTATPIPRTIALTIYKDLDLSIIDEMPKNRLPVKTWVIPESKREAAYAWIRQHVAKTDEQAFILCPFIEESETLTTIKAAKVEFDRLSKEVFPDLRLALLHGQLKPTEKETLLTNFRQGKTDVLVCTPIVEVGIDIPTATIMLIEAADRFGLAQLHQLRGRVGRGELQSYCLLFPSNTNPTAVKRLKNLETLNSGLQLAEVDLTNRGAGEVFGVNQHGFSTLKIASLSDLSLIEQTNLAATAMLKTNWESNSALHDRLKKYKIPLVQPN